MLAVQAASKAQTTENTSKQRLQAAPSCQTTWQKSTAATASLIATAATATAAWLVAFHSDMVGLRSMYATIADWFIPLEATSHVVSHVSPKLCTERTSDSYTTDFHQLSRSKLFNSTNAVWEIK